MSAGAAAYAPHAPGRLRITQPLWIFIAASVSLHALMLAYTPGGGGGTAHERQARAPLHAVLAPLPSGNAVPEEPIITPPQEAAAGQAADAVAQAAPAEAMRPGAGAPGVDLPLPDKWYTGLELSVLAEPLEFVKLAYPDEFAGSTIIAKVRVRLFVDERGTVQKIELVESGPHPAFDAAAIRQWQEVRFKPGIRNGIAVKSQKLLELEFLPF